MKKLNLLFCLAFSVQLISQDVSEEIALKLEAYCVDKANGSMIPNSEVELVGSDGSHLYLKCDSNGVIICDSIEGESCLNLNTKYSIKASTPDYLVAKDNFDTEGLEESRTFVFEFLLVETTCCFGCGSPPPVYFDYNDDEPRFFESLDYLLDLLGHNSSLILEFHGHADATECEGIALSERRARSCVGYLNSKGIDIGRLKFKGLGDKNPVFSDLILEQFETKKVKML